jgi:hypothetical protein
MKTSALVAVTVLASFIGPTLAGLTPARADDYLQFGPAPTTAPKDKLRDATAPPAPQPRKSPLPQTQPSQATQPLPKSSLKPTPATTIPKPGEAPMRVVLVRDVTPGCQPMCAEWISAQGYIDKNASLQFKKILNGLGSKKLPILIDSPGGSVDDALAIGRLIRAKGLDVVVTKTKFMPTPPGSTSTGNVNVITGERGAAFGTPQTYGTPQAYLSKCASSCAFILAAGTRRMVGAYTLVGVHQLRTFQTFARLEQKYRIHTRLEWGVPREIKRELVAQRTVGHKTVETKTGDRVYRNLQTYFTQMGIQPAIMPMITSTPAASMYWLTAAELKSTGMMTDALNGEQLLKPASPSPVPPAIPLAPVSGTPAINTLVPTPAPPAP